MLNGGRFDSGLARNAPIDSQNEYHLGSTWRCSNVLDSNTLGIDGIDRIRPWPPLGVEVKVLQPQRSESAYRCGGPNVLPNKFNDDLHRGSRWENTGNANFIKLRHIDIRNDSTNDHKHIRDVLRP